MGIGRAIRSCENDHSRSGFERYPFCCANIEGTFYPLGMKCIPPHIGRMSFETTSLWKASLDQVGTDSTRRHLERLRTEFHQFRSRVGTIVERIGSTLPGLTQHELTHLDALWEMASLVAGPDYPLNPLEGFVFGGAVLLHDSGLCFEAFKGGRSAVRSSTAWKDAFELEKQRSPNRRPDEIEEAADFVALRALHGEQAQVLATSEWSAADGTGSVFLVQDLHLRTHLGVLMGQIAASHNWSIEDVASRFAPQINAPAEFPRDWRIHPVKIACLLRCADALHMDNRRAPDFLHALLRRSGISFAHWQAQNRIGRIDLDQDDKTGSTILITSTRAFNENEAPSWWIAYDASTLAGRELASCDTLLARLDQNSCPRFRATRIKGVESPEQMARYIQTEGWTPCSAAIHVSNVEHLVRSLGGKNLYGDGSDHLNVVVRELIQNARDAVRAREAFQPGYDGRIVVRLRTVGSDQVIEVEDDGIGMSQRVLTGPLLDFGTSFWATNLVTSEFPGLRSSQFRPVGKFGIGFYSVFMISDHVTVCSRRWDEGISQAREIVFKNGVAIRPLLRPPDAGSLGVNMSTKVSLWLKTDDRIAGNVVSLKYNYGEFPDISVTFDRYIALIAAGLDVNVLVDTGAGAVASHRRQPVGVPDREAWLMRISLYDDHRVEAYKDYVKRNVGRLRPIYENGSCCGLAAISSFYSYGPALLSMPTVGGLSQDVRARGGNYFIGFLEHHPKSARREQDAYVASPAVLKSWATDQMALIQSGPLNDLECFTAATSLAQFGVDPTPILRFALSVDGSSRFYTLGEAITLSKTRPIVFLKGTKMDFVDSHHGIRAVEGHALFIATAMGDFLKLTMTEGVPAEGVSVIRCLHQYCIQNRVTPRWTVSQGVGAGMLGKLDAVVFSAA